ncbi:MAG: hypothetical protein SGILL_009097 [Bacillariaceae sp.]
MNNNGNSAFLDWEMDERFLQDEDETTGPGADSSNSTSVPATAPTASTTEPAAAAAPSEAGVEEESTSVPGEDEEGTENVPGSAPTASGETFPPAPTAPIAPTTPLPPSPTSWVTDSPGWSPTPTLPPNSGGGGSNTAGNPYKNNQFLGVLLVLVLGVVGIVCAWKFCKVWKARRERQMLRLQSTRVDATLGDLQMVDHHDEYGDDDPELL